MKIKYNQPIEKSKYRKGMAEFVARCTGHKSCDEIPYKPNEHDDYYWTVDHGNDWKVKFFRDEPCVMEIIHRYNNAEAVKSLANWVAYRTGGNIMESK